MDPRLLLLAGQDSGESLLPSPPRWIGPWSSDGETIAFVVGEYGADPKVCRPPDTGLSNRVEYPPFDDAIELQTTADGLRLRDGPSAESPGLECLPLGAVVTVTAGTMPCPEIWEGVDGCSPGWDEAHVETGRYWFHVRTAAGNEGWIDSRSVDWASED